MKIFVLIMHMYYTDTGVAIATHEFNSEASCKVAEKEFERDTAGFIRSGYAFCVEK